VNCNVEGLLSASHLTSSKSNLTNGSWPTRETQTNSLGEPVLINWRIGMARSSRLAAEAATSFCWNVELIPLPRARCLPRSVFLGTVTS
jgi:hypothetical protein